LTNQTVHALLRLCTLPASAKVLDVACGPGYLAEAVARAQPDAAVTALDFSANMLDLARARLRSLRNVSFVEGDAEALPFSDGQFDAIFCNFGVLHLGTEAAGGVLASLTRLFP
jgi:ubiquinone/menaquinone biosynthesis C-methylase UbiE